MRRFVLLLLPLLCACNPTQRLVGDWAGELRLRVDDNIFSQDPTEPWQRDLVLTLAQVGNEVRGRFELDGERLESDEGWILDQSPNAVELGFTFVELPYAWEAAGCGLVTAVEMELCMFGNVDLNSPETMQLRVDIIMVGVESEECEFAPTREGFAIWELEKL